MVRRTYLQGQLQVPAVDLISSVRNATHVDRLRSLRNVTVLLRTNGDLWVGKRVTGHVLFKVKLCITRELENVVGLSKVGSKHGRDGKELSPKEFTLEGPIAAPVGTPHPAVRRGPATRSCRHGRTEPLLRAGRPADTSRHARCCADYALQQVPRPLVPARFLARLQHRAGYDDLPRSLS